METTTFVVLLLASLLCLLDIRLCAAASTVQRPGLEAQYHRNATMTPSAHRFRRILEETPSSDGGEGSCTTSRDCEKPKICVQGTCTCPVLYRGSDGCTPTILPRNASDWCVMPVNSPVFRKYTSDKYNENKKKKKRNFWNPDNAQWKFFGDATQSKLSKFRDNNAFAKCAVVGSSNSLTKKQYGELIDSHGVVIRFNAAPTRGFQKYVGKRTDIRVQNIRYCGSSRRDEYCIHYSRNQDPKSHQCRRWRRCKKIQLHNQVVEYIQHYWRVVPKPPGRTDRGKRDAKLSAGFFGIVLAMHVCAEVNIFGFSQGAHHYYKKGDKKFMKGKPFYTRHRWLYESACMNLLREGAYAGVTVYN
ncbi:sialyltransferase [Chloropicon primus]|uniref:beta-galactoside alpha-(2,6)-sialyltransferase n=1 Tax=Chloropicon primus TaxID=1764295 RepID=A0A5B8MXJ3_9CHLO|nr:sialyltransferase [Chloropicon primus]UPR03408.1 sialyltransferase [Chloropicon primus]|eukprot:QDZ24200.1 sialyltransferase [Chloropicon primus]